MSAHHAVHIHWLGAVGSTNDEVRGLAEGGAPSGTVVVASEQRAGRGRLGRSWLSAPGVNVLMSFLHRSALEPARLSGLTLEAATATAEVVAARGLQPTVKWPNDVLVGRRKLAGILTELVLDDDGRRGGAAAIVGVGLNVNARRDALPREIAEIATSVCDETGAPTDPARLVVDLSSRLAERFAGFEARGGPDIPAYLAYFGLAGQRVAVERLEPSREATVLGVEADGALRVRRESDGVEVLVRSGEVTPLTGRTRGTRGMR